MTAPSLLECPCWDTHRFVSFNPNSGNRSVENDPSMKQNYDLGLLSNEAQPQPPVAVADVSDSAKVEHEAGTPTVPRVSFWKTKVGKMLMGVVAIILIASIVGGSLGATRARARHRTHIADKSPSSSREASPTSSSTAAPSATLISWVQANWRWCNKCQALAYGGFADLGPCPASGLHDHFGSGDYSLIVDAHEILGEDESDWRWCNKCQALAFADSPSLGSCSAGGMHDHTGSGNYVLAYSASSGAPPGRQDNWRWCNKCQVPAFAGFGAGPCSAGGFHDHSGSVNYMLNVS